MKTDYLKFVQWSEEDQLFIGYCPDLFIGGVCHGTDEQEVYRELSRLVADEIAQSEREKRPQDRTVSRRSDGVWENKRNDSDRAASTHDTQREAIEAARIMLKNRGGGELTTKGVDGKIASKDTVVPSNDPKPPRDRKR